MISDRLFTLAMTKQHHKMLFETVYNDVPLLIIRYPNFNAILSLQGAQLLHWQHKGHPPIIWLSDKAIFSSGSAIRGGIPICWPWFGNIKSPSHGFARNMRWQLLKWENLGNSIKLNLQLRDSQQTRQLWPHSFVNNLQITLGEECEITMAVQGNFESTAALHSYFHVGEVTQTTIDGLGQHYFDKIEQRKVELPPSQIRTQLTEATDRIYQQPKPISHLIDPNLGREIIITHYNASDVVLWNPWNNPLEDMSGNDYRHMLCIETARIQSKLNATPQNSAQFGCHIQVVPQHQ